MPEVTGQKIVVIGGNGWLGSAAVKTALAHHAKVTILSRHASASTSAANAVQGSITDAKAVREAVKGAKGIVISVEASRTPEQLNAVYVQGTRNVLEAVLEEAHIIFMGHIGITHIERMPDYNRAKLMAEELIRNSGRAYTIIRPSWVVSAEEGERGVKLEQGDHYTGRRDDIGSGDLGACIVAAFESPEARGKSFELYSGSERTPIWSQEFARLEPDAPS
jgi:uncharacterized protein YbjT (DUF2867 family)